MTVSTCDIAIVGAGPYGLATAAHLRAVGVEARVFGEPMTFWQRQLRVGMYLRSSWEASHIADPQHAWTLDTYQHAHGTQVPAPVPLDSFIHYGLWFQGQAVPDVDRRTVTRLAATSSGFRLLLEDGEPVHAKRVVVAAGIAPFAWQPPQFGALASSLASHSSEHRDFGPFAGKRVLVIGGGQSALESAALLHEAGAEVEVVARAPHIRWLHRSAWLHRGGGLLRRLLYPPTDVGPPALNWIVALPDLFRCLPRELQDRVAQRSIRPAGARWLPPRLAGVPITTGRGVVAAVPSHEWLRVQLDDGSARCVEHILLATGYRVDIARYEFLAPELVRSVVRRGGYPQLARGFESSVPGLHFVGAPAAVSFGPLMRFVSGTGYAAGALVHCLRNGYRRP